MSHPQTKFQGSKMKNDHIRAIYLQLIKTEFGYNFKAIKVLFAGLFLLLCR